MSETVWILDDAISLCREIEPTLAVNGYHVAIGGSVLRDGKSSKDLDIFIYPHRTTECCDIESIHGVLYSHHRMLHWRKHSHENYGDGKNVWSARRDGKRIDFFFLS